MHMKEPGRRPEQTPFRPRSVQEELEEARHERRRHRPWLPQNSAFRSLDKTCRGDFSANFDGWTKDSRAKPTTYYEETGDYLDRPHRCHRTGRVQPLAFQACSSKVF
jgi:hypothetical protein